jgi:hypothetical protein
MYLFNALELLPTFFAFSVINLLRFDFVHDPSLIRFSDFLELSFAHGALIGDAAVVDISFYSMTSVDGRNLAPPYLSHISKVRGEWDGSEMRVR